MEDATNQQSKHKEYCAHRPFAFDKMEKLVQEMQDPENGIPIRSQKLLFITSIPSAFMGYDLIEWLMERLNIEESVEAIHIANQLCQYGYFFPITDSKTLIVKDDSSLYRFQSPYYWPWQHRTPENVEYAIYLTKRTLRNKLRHGLEEYEITANDVQPVLLDLKQRYMERRETFQPVIVAVEPVLRIVNYYVVINEKLFNVDSILGAIEVAFHIFFALDYNYQKNTEVTWVF